MQEEIKKWIDENVKYETKSTCICPKCKEFVCEYFSHHSLEAFSHCCGKRLEEHQHQQREYIDNYNYEQLLDIILEDLKSN